MLHYRQQLVWSVAAALEHKREVRWKKDMTIGQICGKVAVIRFKQQFKQF